MRDRTAGLPEREMIIRRFLKRSRGQSLVEFGIIVPVLLLLVLGAIDFGRVYFAYVSVTNGARNGAQYAALSPEAAADSDGIREAAVADTSDLLDTSETNPEVAVATGTDSGGGLYADVTVSYTYSTLFPWPGLPDSIDLSRTVRARVAP
jgi:Flp pilus assembly protein TadG